MSEKLQISHIELDGGTQARAGLNDAVVAEYRQLVEQAQEEGQDTGETIWPFRDPVVIFYDGTNHWLGDGFHRIAACRQAGRYVVEADIRQGTRREAILFAAGANADHGLRRTDEDKRRAVRRLLEDDEWGKWADREIARRCKVSPTFVGSIRRELTVHVDSEPAAERVYVTRHGNEAVMNTARIGRETAVTRQQMREEQIPFQTESGHIATLNPSAFAALKILRDRGHTVEHINPTNPGAPHDELRVWKVDGREPINKIELWAMADAPDGPAPPASATAKQMATYWLKHYVDPVHNRIWTDLEDNQVHHANSPCFQAFKKQYPDIGNHKALLKVALANLKRERAAGIAESIKGLWDATLRLVAQASGRDLIGQLNWAAVELDRAYKIAKDGLETAVSEEAS